MTVVGGNLFQLAAGELGDATQWIRIAQLNNIPDPFFSDTLVLLIPERILYSGSGIAPQ
jgi:hypothetical protein